MFELLSIIFKWKKPIIVATVLITLGAVVASLFLDNYFKSTVHLIPMSSSVLDRATVFPSGNNSSQTYIFGGKPDIDRLISLGESATLSQYLINKFDLKNYYEIEDEGDLGDFKVADLLQKRFSISKNDRGIVEIEVIDKDPVFAAQMANDISSKLDTLYRELISSKRGDLLTLMKTKRDETHNRMEVLKDSLASSIKSNPTDTVTSGTLNRLLKSVIGEYTGTQLAYSQSKTLLNQKTPTLIIVEKAQAAKRKFKPKRSMIVFGAFLFSIIFSIFSAVVVEQYRVFQSKAKDQ